MLASRALPFPKDSLVAIVANERRLAVHDNPIFVAAYAVPLAIVHFATVRQEMPNPFDGASYFVLDPLPHFVASRFIALPTA